MNTKQMMRYTNKSKSASMAYILGFLSYFIPFGFHKWYLGKEEAFSWHICYGLLWVISLLTQSSVLLMFMGIATIPWFIFMVIDAFITHKHVKEFNEKLIEELDSDNYTP